MGLHPKVEPEELFPSAPSYGTGVARRRIRLTGGAGHVLAELEDGFHGMRCIVEHDGFTVTAVIPEFIRVPLNTCAGAGDPLSQIVGAAVGSDFGSFFRDGRARLNCTHMFDLAWLATAHAARGQTVRDYEVEIPDEAGGTPAIVRLLRDGALVLEWSVASAVIQTPPLQGRHLFRGFTTWAVEHYAGDALEALLMLQKGYFVAQARRFSFQVGPIGAREKKANTGLCYGFAEERIDEAERLGSNVRDFSRHPERLLRYQ